MQYNIIPKAINSSQSIAKGFSWSPSMFRHIEIPNSNTRTVDQLIDDWDKGQDPGSLYYLNSSSHHLIRTKALQEHSTLISTRGDSITPLNPKAFVSLDLSDGDILLSKDSNVGECAMVNGHRWRNHTISGGVVRLRAAINRFYLFAFLKHPLFREELYSMVPRGATIAHAKTLWLNCRIPFPSQPDAERVEDYVSALMEAIFEKEQALQDRNDRILRLISHELATGQRTNTFTYRHPTSLEVATSARLDAAIYGVEYKSKAWLIGNYRRGFRTPIEAGFQITPGPSLEIKLLRTRVDSDVPKPGFYTLLIPANISEYGTMRQLIWLGTAKELPRLRRGDVLFGEAGFGKGRTIVLVDEIENATTNAHGLYARRSDNDLSESIFFRCIFHWYRHVGLIDLMAVGGSGGHFSPEYFQSLLIPNFPDELKQEIVSLYHSPAKSSDAPSTISEFVKHHSQRNGGLGIWELSKDMAALQSQLRSVQEGIIKGETVKLAID